ncbi:UNVERIFIED_ORG: heme/copper-type cytochrome/quinol oxidase subunit 2 [Arthrobacter globiformis]|nr:heme/copper-type cytochrome/quinol oxidase subunit 2 [Arthrobacter globiformis]
MSVLQAFGSGCWRWILLAAAALVTVVMLMIVGCFVTFAVRFGSPSGAPVPPCSSLQF